MFDQTDLEFLSKKMRSGEVVLFLGAGASDNCRNSDGLPVFKGNDLEQEFRRILTEDGRDLDLKDLAEDVESLEGERGFHRILEKQFFNCTASAELTRLFRYTWFRCYTLNYDDSILAIPLNKRAQKPKYFSRKSSFEEERNFSTLQTIYLNGSIRHLADGFVLSAKQYRAELLKASAWYKKCAIDFVDRSFIFIGTELDEPIFQAHIEALQSARSTTFSRSFLITPTKPSERKIKKLRSYNIEFIEGTLKDLVNWLETKLGECFFPEDVLANQGRLTIQSDSEMEIASQLIEIGLPNWIESKRVDAPTRRRLGRDFYSGIAATWETILNDIPAKIECVKEVTNFINARSKSTDGKIVIVRGQSGSGKATATMTGLFELSLDQNGGVFEMPETESYVVTRAIKYLGTLGGGKKFLYIPSIHLHIDYIHEISLACERSGVDVFGQIRNSDWTGRFGRRKRYIGEVHELRKLTNTDYITLSKSLDEHAVAPEFRKLTQTKKIELLRKSGRQLLILMMEATKQRRFEKIIEDEFNSISDDDAKAVFCIVALITMSRSRLSVGEIEDIVIRLGVSKSFGEILGLLDGMVEVGYGNSLIGRHDLFVRHIIEKTAHQQILKNAVIAILQSFTIFREPFVKNAGKVKGNILKYLMRARFLQEVFGRDSYVIVSEIYEELEYAYQNDGHFWLQRGKFFQVRGEHEEALRYFYRSVEAFDNEFARHSLAHQKLILCSTSTVENPRLARLLTEGVSELERQIDVRDDAEDEYPIVALSTLHPEVLLKWGKLNEAIEKAREYFERLKVFERRLTYVDNSVVNAKSFCLHLVTQGSIPDRLKKWRNQE